MMNAKINAMRKNGRRRLNRIRVDVANRLQKSFGSGVTQQIEITYQGKPMDFTYLGQVEVINITSLQNGLSEAPDERMEDRVENVTFDPTRQRQNEIDVHISCTCGASLIGVMPAILRPEKMKAEKILEIIAKNDFTLRQHYNFGNHNLSIDYTEIRTEVIPEDRRISDFAEAKIQFLRLFPTKTADVKYIATYGQDVLAEAPQVKYSKTKVGGKRISNQNLMFAVFIWSISQVITFVVGESQASNYYRVGYSAPNLLPWYIVLGVVLLMTALMWRIHIHDLGNSYVKVVDLQSGPFYASNSGVLPAIMVNSTIHKVWDHQAEIMHVSTEGAQKVFDIFHSWHDNLLADLHRQNVVGNLQRELMSINNDLQQIAEKDMEWKLERNATKKNWSELAIAVVLTIGVYSLAMYIVGIF